MTKKYPTLWRTSSFWTLNKQVSLRNNSEFCLSITCTRGDYATWSSRWCSARDVIPCSSEALRSFKESQGEVSSPRSFLHTSRSSAVHGFPPRVSWNWSRPRTPKARYERQRSLALYPFVRTYHGIEARSMSRVRTYFRDGLRGMLVIRVTESAPDIAVRKQIERYFIFFTFPSFSLVLSFYHSRGYEIQIHIISHITNNNQNVYIHIANE